MRFLIPFAIGTFSLFAPLVSFAQTGTQVDMPVTPVISGPSDIPVGRTLILDASDSLGTNETTQYRWYREGEPRFISEIVDVVYTPEQTETTEFRLVLRTFKDGQWVDAETTHRVTVYDRKVVLVADSTVSKEKIAKHTQQANELGVYLRVLQPEESAIPLGVQESLVNAIANAGNVMAGAESIILWTDGLAGLQVLQRTLEVDADRLSALQNQAIVLITDGGLNTLARTARGPFTTLQPDRIIVTRKEAINPLLSADNVDAFLARLDQWDIDYLVVDESSVAVRPWNLITSLVNYMLTHGVSSQTVILLLMLPVIATILAFLKQVIGITTFGLYTPSIIALSFLALGWNVAIPFLLFILITGYATRSAMRQWRLLYIPKVAIILTVVSFTLLILLGIGAYFGLTLSGDTIFVLLIMSTLSESFLNLKTEEGLYNALIGISETILAALLCVFIVQWSALRSLIIGYPELILLTFVINIFLGRWTGLRLVEYFRFREVFKHLQEE